LQIQGEEDAAGRKSLSDNVPRFTGATTIPTEDYTALVRSAAFTGAPAIAASAAAAAALKEKANPLSTASSIQDQAKAAAINALASLYSAASRSLLTSLPMSGAFARGASGLTADIRLPANHPTNPFRHRRHPDHTTGIDIRRVVSLDFDATDQSPRRAGFGVERVTGTYREEIHGLHKPLGPNRDVGLKVRGTFSLSRISFIDTLNGR
jgi:hypothetical protein